MDDFQTFPSFSELAAGANCTFDVLQLPDFPTSIRDIESTDLREHAEMAWIAAWTLRSLWGVWSHFLHCGRLKVLPDEQTQAMINERFPSLNSLRDVCNAFAHVHPLSGKKRANRKTIDQKAEIDRSRPRMSRKSRQFNRTNGLQILVSKFQDLNRRQLLQLEHAGIVLPVDRQPVVQFQEAAHFPFAVALDLDATGDESHPSIDFEAEVTRIADSRFRDFQSRVGKLISLLQDRPTSVLGSQHPHCEPPRPGTDEETDVRDDGEASEAKPSSPYLGLHLDGFDFLTQDGSTERIGLTKTQARAMKKLIAAAGSTVDFEILDQAIEGRSKPQDLVSSADRNNIQQLISRLRRIVEKSFELQIKSERNVGYKLLPAKPDQAGTT